MLKAEALESYTKSDEQITSLAEEIVDLKAKECVSLV